MPFHHIMKPTPKQQISPSCKILRRTFVLSTNAEFLRGSSWHPGVFWRFLLIFLLVIITGARPLRGQGSGTTRTWSGSVSSDWFDPNNWSPVGVPGAVDTVNFATGTINLTAAVTIGGQFNWSGGTLEGSPLTVGSNAVMNLLGSGTLSLYGPLTNEGTVNWTGNCDLLVQNYNGTYGYSGGIVNQAGAIWNIQCDQTIQANGGYGGTPYFNNAGLLRKSGDGDEYHQRAF